MRWRGGLWLVPSLMLAGFIAVALLLVEAQSWLDLDLGRAFPRVFGAGADGARSMLSAIATSMITVAGVVFSVTLVALSLASTQYSPSVLRNFMDDRPTQVAMGMFVGIFAYCLVVLRTVRSEDAGGFLPSLAVLGGVLLALLGVGTLIWFIHHVTVSIQAPSIVARIARETARAIDRLYPEPLGEPAPRPLEGSAGPAAQWWAVGCESTGYVLDVDAKGLLEFAAGARRVVRLNFSIGDFVVEGQPMAYVSGGALEREEADTLHGLVHVGSQRNVEQDVPHGLQQIVDVAVKALSPGINDPSTAAACIDQLSALLIRLAGRRIPPAERGKADVLHVVAPRPGFDAMAMNAFVPLISHARGEPMVLERLLRALDRLIDAPRDLERRATLCRIAVLLEQQIERGVELPVLRDDLLRCARTLARRSPGADVHLDE
jgi:uncharacterized membrane protein